MPRLPTLQTTAILLALSLLIYPAGVLALEKTEPVERSEPRVYFEEECLALFSTRPSVGPLAENETKVEESRSQISFEKLTVTESRAGHVVNTYIQVRNCRPAESSDRH